jgi:hypothetical protein
MELTQDEERDGVFVGQEIIEDKANAGELFWVGEGWFVAEMCNEP